MELLKIKIFYLEEYIVGHLNGHNQKHKDDCLIQAAVFIVGELPY